VSVREKLARRASKAGLSLPREVAEGLEAYFELLRRWNRKVSLTALPVEDIGDEAIDRLLIEPVLAARFLTSPRASVIDIGSGGGSPAIPVKLALPGISLRMVESKTRKAAFLREVVRTLRLDEVSAHVDAVRFEELLARPDLHEAADVLTMRAVRIDGKRLTGLQSFVKPSGLLFLFGTRTTMSSQAVTPHVVSVGSHVLLRQWGSQLDVLQKKSSS
jgi:16S rRNA (guanine527-N7)-methyltransferase